MSYPNENERTEEIVYDGSLPEVKINYPYRQLFRRGEVIRVTPEMSKLLKPRPDFKGVYKKKEEAKKQEPALLTKIQ